MMHTKENAERHLCCNYMEHSLGFVTLLSCKKHIKNILCFVLKTEDRCQGKILTGYISIILIER